ncbi:hypothetical protein AB6A40_005530 [Gnathostoma spinigerum]|uniref:Uncharacterized protein n=1 Tax=Gnathostoma spinigerum TaxID=75299 RepID=A0ABD6EN12_9BILA
MPLPPVVTKFLDDIDKKLHEQNQLTTVLEWVEEKTGLKRLHIVLGFAALHILCLTFSNSAELICNIIGFVYPAFMS